MHSQCPALSVLPRSLWGVRGHAGLGPGTHRHLPPLLLPCSQQLQPQQLLQLLYSITYSTHVTVPVAVKHH